MEAALEIILAGICKTLDTDQRKIQAEICTGRTGGAWGDAESGMIYLQNSASFHTTTTIQNHDDCCPILDLLKYLKSDPGLIKIVECMQNSMAKPKYQ